MSKDLIKWSELSRKLSGSDNKKIKGRFNDIYRLLTSV